MKIGLLGGGSYALAALRELHGAHDLNVTFVYPRYGRADPVAEAAAATAGIAIAPFDSLRGGEVQNWIATQGVDLLVSVDCKDILTRAVLDLTRHGAINFHAGLLPRQRGGGGDFIGLLNQDCLGVTVHFVDEGIDTGDIILQQEIPLGAEQTLAEFDRLALALCPGIVVTAVRQILHGCAWRREQRTAPYYYVPAKPEWDEFIDWAEPSQLIYDKVRGRKKGVNFCLVDGRKFYIHKVEKEPLLLDHFNSPAQVLIRNSDRGVLVKTLDNGLWLNLIADEPDGQPYRPDFRPGTRLAQHLHGEVYQLRREVARLSDRLDALEAKRA